MKSRVSVFNYDIFIFKNMFDVTKQNKTFRTKTKTPYNYKQKTGATFQISTYLTSYTTTLGMKLAITMFSNPTRFLSMPKEELLVFAKSTQMLVNSHYYSVVQNMAEQIELHHA